MELGMHRQRDFLLLATLAAAAATPALGQDAAPDVGVASSATQSAASIPDFSRMWANSLGPGFSPPASGPGPVLNKARQRAAVDIYGQPLSVTNAPIVSAGGPARFPRSRRAITSLLRTSRCAGITR